MFSHRALSSNIWMLLLVFALPLEAGADDLDSVDLTSGDKKGWVLDVQDDQADEFQSVTKKDGRVMIHGQGRWSQRSKYREEVKGLKPRNLERTYKESSFSRGKGAPSKINPDPFKPTSANEKTMVLDDKGVRLTEGDLDGSERQSLLVLGALNKALLPNKKIDKGKSWALSAEAVGRAFFGEAYNAKHCKVKGKGKLDKFEGKGEDAKARLSFKFEVKLTIPGEKKVIKWKWKGEADFDLGDSYLTRLQLKAAYQSNKLELKKSIRQRTGRTVTHKYITTRNGRRLIHGKFRLVSTSGSSGAP